MVIRPLDDRVYCALICGFGESCSIVHDGITSHAASQCFLKCVQLTFERRCVSPNPTNWWAFLFASVYMIRRLNNYGAFATSLCTTWYGVPEAVENGIFDSCFAITSDWE